MSFKKKKNTDSFMMKTALAGGKQKKFTGLEKKITGKFLMIVIACNILMGAVSAVLNYTSALGALSESMNETSSVASMMVEAELKEYLAIAFETGSIARLSNPDVSVEDKRYIIDQRVDVHNFETGTVVGADGIDIFNGTDYSERPVFQTCMKGETFISTPTVNEGKLIVGIAAPLWQDGDYNKEPAGVIIFTPQANFMDEIMKQIKIGEGGTAFMLDKNGITIASVEEGMAGVQNDIEDAKKDPALKDLAEIEKRMMKLEDGYGMYTYGGKSKIVSYSAVGGTDGWSIGVTAVKNEFMDKFYFSIVVTVVLVILFVFAGIWNGRKLGKEIASSIARCVDRLGLLAKGDLQTEVPEPATNDETALLLGSLKETVEQLGEVISDISSLLGELSRGNFNIEIEKTYNGDFAEISRSLKEITRALNDAFRSIDANSDRVASGAEDLSKASQGLAEGATDQASSIEELTATITDISEKIQENAENAESAKNVVGEMNREILESNSQMNQMTEAMERIKSASNEIANIIKTIEDIATQTNLLSLNAAIEAARAGEAGKGFAVVADEVRSLAEQSAIAAKNTTQMIENSIHAVDEGMRLTSATAESLALVVENGKKVDQAITEISKASSEQADAAAQITQGVNQIAGVVESNSATAQESAAASEELSGESIQLKELLSRFSFKK